MAASTPAAPEGHTVVTYNMLSNTLADPASFPWNEEEDLRAAVRWSRIEAKLIEWMEQDAILCLQEVSLAWSAKLSILCAENGYIPIWHGYGSSKSGHMGVAVAVPTAKYRVKRVQFTRTGSFINKVLPYTGEGSTAASGEDSYDVWSEARMSHNYIVFVHLETRLDEAQSVGVASYHMPCRFRGLTRGVMTLHAWAVASMLKQWSKECGCPVLVGGDWNFKPEDVQYELLSTGGSATMDAATDPLDDDPRGSLHSPYSSADWSPSTQFPLQSAYRTVHGADPDFTNFSRFAGSTEHFLGTLDMVWVGPNIRVTGAPILPAIDCEMVSSGRYMPNAEEPSDHLPVQIMFTLS
jgi:exonuclease III